MYDTYWSTYWYINISYILIYTRTNRVLGILHHFYSAIQLLWSVAEARLDTVFVGGEEVLAALLRNTSQQVQQTHDSRGRDESVSRILLKHSSDGLGEGYCVYYQNRLQLRSWRRLWYYIRYYNIMIYVVYNLYHTVNCPRCTIFGELFTLFSLYLQKYIFKEQYIYVSK